MSSASTPISILTTGSQRFLSLVSQSSTPAISASLRLDLLRILGVLNGLGARAFQSKPTTTACGWMRRSGALKIEADGELDRVKLIYLVLLREPGRSVSRPNGERSRLKSHTAGRVRIGS
jgi:hypothetical protein